ncbi:6-hydroxymethylpterin diphosphokinase MptE-like protein [Flaviramulus aquimarinus]
MSVVNFIDNYKRDVQFYIKWLLRKDLRIEMSRNKTLKNVHKGKRCFIVGNGPSLKHHDLSKLTNEPVFTVNNMMMTDYFKILNPNFHLFFDPNFLDFFFNQNPQNEDEKNKMQSIRKSLELNSKLIYFTLYRKKSTFTKLFPSLKSHYLFNNKMFTSSLKKTSTLHRNTPAFQNVIIYAINIALYMGFDEIYLLGVDMTGFLEHYEFNTINDKWGHVYNKSEEDQEKLNKFRIENNIDNEFCLKNFGKTFQQFKEIQNNVLSKKAKLFNASAHGALDMIPRVDYEKIFSNEDDV